MEEIEFPNLQPGLSSILQLPGIQCLILNFSNITGVPFDKFPGRLVSLRELRIQWCRGDPNVTNLLTEQMPSLEIHSSFEEEIPAYNTEGQESDAQVAEEEDEENAGPGDADESQDGSWENDKDSNDDSSSSSDSESNNIIWDESSISVLFLEDI
ncbi:uncharacterized protein LOC124552579 [Schistocerca americana]|uniref:uncharacterized protein LOC124552579 n=1 Tax=Schistocerca americana TaxID=7009 RepID=UPI001F4FFF55|nr:uncharacterized protein LOC124552579 [Schistocerca americana]